MESANSLKAAGRGRDPATLTVCMATCNGERYIRPQMDSILQQLGPEDRIILVDDASSDQTVALVEGYSDPRIRIIRNEKNLGAVKSFERALSEATGDIVFLSDQDDVWMPAKVAKVLDALRDPRVTLVQSDACIVNAAGAQTGASYFATRGGFAPGVFRNVLRSRYLGCTMAFRREILSGCLPFPRNIPMHDIWIGLINAHFGRTVFLAEPLVAYRRHGNNVSRPGSSMQRLRWRANLLFNVARVWLRRP